MSRLHVDSIQKRYDERTILSDIYLSCHKGEIVGILGRNGSGKSTLLKIIHQSIPADYRFVKAGDQVLNTEKATLKKLAYLPQENFLPGHLKIRTSIRTWVNKRDLPEICEVPAIKDALNKKPHEISKGTQRFIETVLTIYSPRDFILLDEPFAGNSPLNCELLCRMIQEQSHSKGFIITDHNYRTVNAVASRLMLLHDGSLKNITAPEDLIFWGYLPG